MSWICAGLALVVILGLYVLTFALCHVAAGGVKVPERSDEEHA